MKKKTKKKILIWLSVVIAISVLLLAGYEIAMDYVSDKAMSLIVSNQIESMLDTGEITYEELLEIAEVAEFEEKVEEALPEEVAPPKKEEAPKPGTPKAPTATEKKEAVEKATDKINDEILKNDKREVMKLITSRLTAAEIKRLAAMLSGGVTSEEIGEAAKIAYARFSGEELTRVKQFWHKYKAGIKRVEE